MAKAGRAKAAPAMPVTEQQWMARDALSTLKRAEEIKADPKLMAQVKTVAKQEAAALAKVTGGRGK